VSQEQGTVHTWRELSRQYAVLSCALESTLKEQHDLGMSEFEVLDRLAEAAQGKLRMQEISDGIHLSQSALSRAVARLERDGLVERCLCPEDRRGVFVVLTEDGRARHTAALPTQRTVISNTLGT
jgi:DNA-binding MarR family transcriptional regulator